MSTNIHSASPPPGNSHTDPAGTDTPPTVPGQTTAALAARRRQAEQMPTAVDTAISQLRRERGRVTVRGIVARAAVPATFLYETPDARTRVQAVVANSRSRHDRTTAAEHATLEATWRERALNAEAESSWSARAP